MSGPTDAEARAWVEESTAEQGLALSVTGPKVVAAAVALLREGRRPEPTRGAKRGESG